MMCVNPNKRISIAGIKKHSWFTRHNPLLVDGHAPDAISLAERLLQGLIVSGDLDFNLHSDGKRANVPESISLTQPETFGPGLDLNLNRLPPSSALPAVNVNNRSNLTDPRRIALSQQITSRSHNVPSSTLDGLGVAAGAAGSQFTQAMNHMVRLNQFCETLLLTLLLQTQWSHVAGGTTRFSPHLTRLFCSALGPAVAVIVIKALDSLCIPYLVKPIQSEADSLSQEMTEDGNANDMDIDMDEGDPKISSTGNKEKGIGSHGARIRVSTTDRRKCALRGEIWIESISGEEDDHHIKKPRTHLLMKRSKGDPLEWRRLFRAVATAEGMKDLIVTA
jgi:serine/threonine-protein kinase Chk1